MSIELFHEAVADAEAAFAKVKSIAADLFGDAKTDLDQVATTAETSGLDAAAKQAEGDAATLAKTAVADASTSTPAADVTTAPTA